MATILIVEDDANARLLTEANLKRFYNTLTAANGREALSVIYDKHVDLILSDIMMPVMDGLSATRAIRALDRPDAKTIPIIATTANAFTDDAEKCLRAGMNAHLPKPLQMQSVIETLVRCCGS